VSRNLDELVDELRDFVREREWEPYHDPKNLAMAVASEAGELLELFRWVHSDHADEVCDDPKRRERVEEEIGDVGLCLLMLCDRLEIDVREAMRSKLEKNREKFPVEEVRGGPSEVDGDSS